MQTLINIFQQKYFEKYLSMKLMRKRENEEMLIYFYITMVYVPKEQTCPKLR